jgi:peptidoglycan/xylan/chitin deacetylase (PgdA/CDA1 family)
MTLEECKLALASGWISLGAHTHSHCILTNETLERRESEILQSIDAIKGITGEIRSVFAYPNGTRRDYSDADAELVQQVCLAAVTAEVGTNSPRSDPMRLRRYPVGMGYDEAVLSSEICGIRHAIAAVLGRN